MVIQQYVKSQILVLLSDEKATVLLTVFHLANPKLNLFSGKGKASGLPAKLICTVLVKGLE